MNYSKRIKKVKKTLKKNEALLLVASEYNANAYWLTGIETGYATLFTDNEAKMYSLNEHADYTHTKIKNFTKKQLPIYLKENKIKTLYCDAKTISFAQKHSPKLTNKIDYAREIKDDEEKKLIREAQRTTKKIVAKVLEKKLYGKTTNQIAGLLELQARELGYALDSFPPIVATNKDAATPHAKPNNTKYCRGDVLLIDCGCTSKHYCGDYTTTVYKGKNKEIKESITAVREAKKAAEKIAKPGVKGKTLTQIAINVLKEYNCSANKRFDEIGLQLGHFIGLNVHDCARHVAKTTLRKGMCFTIEPGVYGDYGVRFEDITLL